jgi:hypothetical protein
MISHPLYVTHFTLLGLCYSLARFAFTALKKYTLKGLGVRYPPAMESEPDSTPLVALITGSVLERGIVYISNFSLSIHIFVFEGYLFFYLF